MHRNVRLGYPQNKISSSREFINISDNKESLIKCKENFDKELLGFANLFKIVYNFLMFYFWRRSESHRRGYFVGYVEARKQETRTRKRTPKVLLVEQARKIYT